VTDDTKAVGSWITVVGGAVMFGTTTYGLVAGVSAGPYGSLPAAVGVSGAGFVGLLAAALAISGRRSWVEPSLAQSGGLACCGAGVMLATPLPGTPLPFGQVWLVGAVLMGFGGCMLLVSAVDRDALATA